MYTTLSPCDMCTGAILLYGIPRVVIGENRTFRGPEDYVASRGVALEVADDPRCVELMEAFIAANPGLTSRFPKTIHFPDYSTAELIDILKMTAGKGRYELTPDAEAKAAAWLEAIPRDEGFGNGRLVRNLFETAVGRQATRLAFEHFGKMKDLLT